MRREEGRRERIASTSAIHHVAHWANGERCFGKTVAKHHHWIDAILDHHQMRAVQMVSVHANRLCLGMRTKQHIRTDIRQQSLYGWRAKLRYERDGRQIHGHDDATRVRFTYESVNDGGDRFVREGVQRKMQCGDIVQPRGITHRKIGCIPAIGQHGAHTVGGGEYHDAPGSPASFASNVDSVLRQLGDE